MLNSPEQAVGSPAVARCRRVAACSSDRSFLAAPVRATLLGQGDTHAAARGSGALELSEGFTDSIRLAIGESLASERRPSFRTRCARRADQLLYQATQVIGVAGQLDPCCAPPPASPSRTKLGSASSWGAGVSLPDALSVDTLLTGLFQLAFRVLVKAADGRSRCGACTMSPWLKACRFQEQLRQTSKPTLLAAERGWIHQATTGCCRPSADGDFPATRPFDAAPIASRGVSESAD